MGEIAVKPGRSLRGLSGMMPVVGNVECCWGVGGVAQKSGERVESERRRWDSCHSWPTSRRAPRARHAMAEWSTVVGAS